MKHLTWLGAAAVSVAILFWGPEPIEAAKGVKKGAEHRIQGTVVSHSNGMLVVHSTAHHKKGKAAKTAQAAAKSRDHSLKVSSTTRVENVRNGTHTPGALSNLGRGEHVLVFEHNGHADRIEIHHHGKKRKT